MPGFRSATTPGRLKYVTDFLAIIECQSFSGQQTKARASGDTGNREMHGWG